MVTVNVGGHDYSFELDDFREMKHKRLVPAQGTRPAEPNFPDRVFGVIQEVMIATNTVQPLATNAAGSATSANNAKIAAEAARDVATAAAVGAAFPYGTTAGTGAAYTLNFTPDIPTAAGLAVRVRFHAANQLGATLKVDAGAASEIVDGRGRVLAAGEIAPNRIYVLIYDGALAKWVVQNISSLTLIQKPEAVFPVANQVVSINPTKLNATPYAPIYSNAGAQMGALTNATYQISASPLFTTIVHSISKSTARFDEVFYNIGLLSPNTIYYWRMRYSDAKGNVSEWSDAAQFTTAASYLFDMLAFEHSSLAASDGRYLTIYDVDVATFTVQNIIADADKIKTQIIYAMDWHPSGRFLAVGSSPASNRLVIYDYGDGIPVKLTIPAWLVSALNSSIYTIRFNKAGDKIFIGSGSTQSVICANFSVAGGIGSQITLPNFPAQIAILAAAFSFDNNYLVITSASNGAIYAYAWVNSIGEPLASPVQVSVPNTGVTAGHGVEFHPRYNQFYVTSNDPANSLTVFNIASNNTVSILQNFSFSQVTYSVTTNSTGTRLFVARANGAIQIFNINGTNTGFVPTSIVLGSSGIASGGGLPYALSLNPQGNLLAVAPQAFPLGAKPRLYDVSADTFVDISSTVPFASFLDAGNYLTYAVAFRFGRYGYPAGV